MTKFILHGGMTSIRNENNKKFHREVLKDLSKNPKILVCLFSIEESRWEEEYKWVKKNFIDNTGRSDLKFELANKKDFRSQLEWAEAVHFRGGNTLLLLGVMDNYLEFKNSLKEKTVSGSSAGALFLVENFYDQDYSKRHKGLGIIPINLITHYQSEIYAPVDEKILEKLKNNEGQELVLLKETEYKVYDI